MTRDPSSDSPTEIDKTEVANSPKNDLGPQTQALGSAHDSASNRAQEVERPVELAGFKILGELARGGMGVVYRALDTNFDRDVAIKVLLPSVAQYAGAVQRFNLEARITAQLQHPCIASAHQLGTLSDGRPYLVMKLVKGQTLQVLLKERRELENDRGRFLAIFEQVCQAIGYAHAHRIIHRDIKPGNVMVGAFGEVQMMDWGLAKIIRDDVPTTSKDIYADVETWDVHTELTPHSGHGSETRTGSIIGTPAYMAPEQAGGEIDKIDMRSDVFGLGAMLCQILTGAPPYRGNDSNALRLQAVRCELQDAMSRLDQCSAEPEVVALCKRCLSVRQVDRPENAAAVATELNRIRDDSEARARRAELDRAEAMVRVAEQSKRRRALRLASGLLGVVLIAGIVGTSLGMWRASRSAGEERSAKIEATIKQAEAVRQRERAEAGEAEALRQRQQAEQERKIAENVRDVLQRRLLRFANPWEFANSNGAISEPSDPNPGPLTVLQLLDRAAQVLSPSTIDKEFPSEPIVQAEILETIGEAYESLESFEKSTRYVQAAHELRAKQRGSYHPQTLASQVHLAFTFLEAGRINQAVELFAKTLGQVEEVLNSESSEAIPQATQIPEFVSSPRSDLIDASMNAVLQMVERRIDPRRYALRLPNTGITEAGMVVLQVIAALPRMERMLERSRARYGQSDRRTIFVQMLTGSCYHATGQLKRALSIYEEVFREAKQSFEPSDFMLVAVQVEIAITRLAMREPSQEVLPLFEKAEKDVTAILGQRHPFTLQLSMLTADVYSNLDRFEDARLKYEYVARFAPISIRESPNVLNSLGLVYLRTGRIPESISAFERALEKSATEQTGLRTTIAGNLGSAYFSAAKYPKAIEIYEKLVESNSGLFGTSQWLEFYMVRLGEAYRQEGRLEDAIRILTLVEKKVKDRSDRNLPEHCMVCLRLGQALRDSGNPEQAIAQFEIAANECERKDFSSTWSAAILRETVLAMIKAGRFEASESWARKLLRVVEKRNGVESTDYADCIASLGLSLLRQSKFPQSTLVLQECKTIREKLVPDHWATFHVQSLLGESLMGEKRWSESEPMLLDGYRGMRARAATIPNQGIQHLRDAANRLAHFYEVTEKPDEVARWQEELSGISSP
jgi:serine/threonine protein kinase